MQTTQLCLGVKTFYPIKSFLIQDENLSPNILGKFQQVKELKHSNLAEYVDIMKGKHGKRIKRKVNRNINRKTIEKKIDFL